MHNPAPSLLQPPSYGDLIGRNAYAPRLPMQVNYYGLTYFIGSASGISLALTGKFGCNGAAAQAPVVSDGTLATVIVALKANGIMS